GTPAGSRVEAPGGPHHADDFSWWRATPPNAVEVIPAHREFALPPLASGQCTLFEGALRAGVVRTVIGSPGRPKMLRISAGSAPVLPNQCGTVVSNAATSPGPSTLSWCPRTNRMRPDST